MNNYKSKLSRSFYNIIILLLILAILFSISKLIFSKKSLNINKEENYRGNIFKLHMNNKLDNSFFIKIIQHTFPNKTVQKQYKLMFSFKDTNKSLLKSILHIDFSNPLTYIQAQFPVAATYNDKLMNNMYRNKDKEIEEDWTKEIHFVDYDGEEKTITVDNNSTINYNDEKIEPVDGDDLGELDKNIFIDDENIVDSLGVVSTVDLDNITMPKTIKVEKNKPTILIYHTHGTESYKPMSEGNYHSLKKEYTVIEAANVIAEQLQKKGYNVIHDITYHDYPSYNGSYGRSAITAKSILEENPSIKVVLDIHRDGYDKIDTRVDKVKLIENSRVKINGEYAARFQFVIGATSKNRKEVENFAHFVKAVSDNKYPGFSKDTLVKQYGSYNQYLSDYSALIELGSNANTIEEAKRAAYYLADVIVNSLNLICE